MFMNFTDGNATVSADLIGLLKSKNDEIADQVILILGNSVGNSDDPFKNILIDNQVIPSLTALISKSTKVIQV